MTGGAGMPAPSPRLVSIMTTTRLHRGFSLFELVMVLSILSILTAVAVPRYARSLHRYRADATAQRIVSALQYAQHHSRSRSKSVEVIFDLAPTNRLRIPTVDSLDHPGQSFALALGEEPFRAIVSSALLDDPLSADDDPRAVIFNGFGIPDSGGSVVISAGTEGRTITVEAETGEVAIN